MKRISYLMILATIGMMIGFTSCEETEDAIGPDIDLIGGNYISSDQTAEPGSDLPFKWTAIAGDAKLETFAILKNGAFVPGWVDYEIPNDQNESFTGEDVLTADQNEGVFSYTFIVTDRDGMADSTTVNITVESSTVPLTDPVDATWQRVGGNDGTGLGMFGLKWTSNTSDVAIISKDGANKLVELNASDWNDITTQEGLIAEITAAADMDDYRGISVKADKSDYTDVLGVEYNGGYYMIKVISSDVSTGNVGTTITVEVRYKEPDTDVVG